MCKGRFISTSLFVHVFRSTEPATRLYFRFARWNIQAGKAKRKIEPDTTLLRNVYRPLFWLIDIQRNSQSKFLVHARSSVCKFPITAIRKNVTQMLAKIRKSQATIYLLRTSAQIYRIANLKVPSLYMVALSELKLNENSEHDEVVMYKKIWCMLESFHFRWYILHAFVTDFLRKKTREIKRNTFSFIL